MLHQSGSYEVNSRAQETLSKIAKIITDYKALEEGSEAQSKEEIIQMAQRQQKFIKGQGWRRCA